MSEIYEFEQNVQELAIRLQCFEVGDRLPNGVAETADTIALQLNTHRAEIREEFPETVNTQLLDRIRTVLEQEKAKRHFDQNPDVASGLKAMDKAFRPRYEQQERVGQWLSEILPKAAKTQVRPKQIIDSLLNHPELAIDIEPDADKYTPAPNKATEPIAQPEEPALNQNATQINLENAPSYEHLLPELADSLLSIMLKNADNEEPRTKINVRTNEFRAILQLHGVVDVALEKALFHDAWEFLEAFYQDYDNGFEVFSHDGGSTRGRKYMINDPEIVQFLWNEGEGDEQTEPTTPQPEIIHVQRETEQPELSPAQTEAFAILKLNQRDRTFIGSNALIKQVADKLKQSQDDIKPEINKLFRQLETQGDIEIFFSSRRVKRLARLI